MRNVISIDALNNCSCDLMANVDDGSNVVVLEIKADTSKNPKLEIHRETVTIDSDLFTYTIKEAWYVAQMGALTFRIVDDEHTGDEFSIEGVNSIKGNLLLKQNSNFSYTLVDIAEDDPQTVVLSPKRLTNEKLGGYYGEDRIGLYYASKGNTVVDKPPGVDGFYLEVNRSEYNYYYQLMFPSNQLRDTLWLRSHAAAGGWSEWVQVGGAADSALSATSTNPVQNKVVKAELDKKLALSGGTMSGILRILKGMNVHYGVGSAGTTGYVKLVTLTINANYANVPIMFEIFQRGRNPRGLISVMFANVNSVDPALGSFLKSGNVNAYIRKSATSKWDIYVQKSEGYDNIEITYYATGHTYMSSKVAIEWVNEHANSLPSGYVEATASDLW